VRHPPNLPTPPAKLLPHVPNCFHECQIHSRRAKLLPRSLIDVNFSSFSTLQTIGRSSCLYEMSRQSKRTLMPVPLAGPPPWRSESSTPCNPFEFSRSLVPAMSTAAAHDVIVCCQLACRIATTRHGGFIIDSMPLVGTYRHWCSSCRGFRCMGMV
jgi:hypothetical protein